MGDDDDPFADGGVMPEGSARRAADAADRARAPMDSGVVAYARTLLAPSVATPVGGTDARCFWQHAERGFRKAVQRFGADVGLLHRLGDGFLVTTGVHGLPEGLHLHVWLSMWDDAARHVLAGRAIRGRADDSALAATVARRLGDAEDPREVLAFPVRRGCHVDGIVELGWRGPERGVDGKRVMGSFYGWLKPTG